MSLWMDLPMTRPWRRDDEMGVRRRYEESEAEVRESLEDRQRIKNCGVLLAATVFVLVLVGWL